MACHRENSRPEGPAPFFSRRFFPNQLPNKMPLPHPKSRKHNRRKENKPNHRRILRNRLKRTINVPAYWNAQNKVKPPHNRTPRGTIHRPFPFRPESVAYIFQSAPLAFSTALPQQNTAGTPAAAQASMREMPFSTPASPPTSPQIPPEF